MPTHTPASNNVISLYELRPSGLSIDPSFHSPRFREWHVEQLLNRSADLLERALTTALQLRGHQEKRHEVVMMLRAGGIIEKRLELIERRKKAIKHRKVAQKKWMSPFIKQRYQEVVNHADKHVELLTSGAPTVSAASENAEITRVKVYLDLYRYTYELDEYNLNIADETDELDIRLSELEIEVQDISERKSILGDSSVVDPLYIVPRFIELIARDFIEACEMLIVASSGLNNIYGYDLQTRWRPSLTVAAPAPDFGTIISRIETNNEDWSAAIMSCLHWNREALRFLLALSQNDQAFIATISVRQRVAPEQWAELLEGTEISFVVPAHYLQSRVCVRTRGLSAYYQSSNMYAPIDVRVTWPKSGVFTYAEGGQGHSISQPFLS